VVTALPINRSILFFARGTGCGIRSFEMKNIRLFVLLVAAQALTSCVAAQRTFGRVLGLGARAMHLFTEAAKPGEDFKLEAREVRDALVNETGPDLTPQEACPELARR
jgi:hypothetical protein